VTQKTRPRALLLLGAALLGVACARAERAERSGEVTLRLFDRSDVRAWLESRGIAPGADDLERIPDGSGVRIRLGLGGAIEAYCDGRVELRNGPQGRTSYYDSQGSVYAWIENGEPKFSIGAVDPKLGTSIVIDPGGRYLLGRDQRSDYARIYDLRRLDAPLLIRPLRRGPARLFSSATEIVLVGYAPDSPAATDVIRFEVRDGTITEKDRIPIPAPTDVWFGGRFGVRNGAPDLSEFALVLSRDPPLGSRLYVFDMRTRELRHVPGFDDHYTAYVACDPLAETGPG